MQLSLVVTKMGQKPDKKSAEHVILGIPLTFSKSHLYPHRQLLL